MKKPLVLLLLAFACVNPAAFAKSPVGEILNSGFVTGFPEGTNQEGKALYFEASTIIKMGKDYVVATDKQIPSHSPLVAIKAKAFLSPTSDEILSTPIDSPAVEKSQKIESLAESRRFNFAATDFEWITEDPQEADAYNNLLRWRGTDIDHAVLLHASERGGVKSSRVLRDSFSTALRSTKYPSGPPYYKVEGLEQIDGVSLIFGIREVGTDYEHPEPCFVVLEAKFEKDFDGLPTISKSFRKVLEFQPKVPGFENLHFGLTALESDKDNKQFIASTASEENGVFNSVFWLFSQTDSHFSDPTLLQDTRGKPLILQHKVEGVVFDGNNVILAICDDDRQLTTVTTSNATLTRKPNQAAYFRIKIKT